MSRDGPVVSSRLLSRLALDFIAAIMLLVGLSYWWLGNAVHELVGTGMFLLVIVHNGFNRRWYGRIPYAVELSKHGYNAFVLKYRTGLGGTVAPRCGDARRVRGWRLPSVRMELLNTAAAISQNPRLW